MPKLPREPRDGYYYWHDPITHVLPPRQATPQVPQSLFLVFKSWQPSSQHVSPALHFETPLQLQSGGASPEQSSPTAHGPFGPQLLQ